MLGTGRRTVDKVLKYDLSWVKKYKPDIVILEMGTNDLSGHNPEAVRSKLDDLVHVLSDQDKVRVVAVCQVINRNLPHTQAPDNPFNTKAALLREYLSVVRAEEQGIFVWEHREYSHPYRLLLSSDGVHCNAQGQYCLYRSYRGVILKALTML